MDGRFFAARIPRRTVSLSALAVGAVLYALLLPMLFVVALVVDARDGYRRRRWMRLLAALGLVLLNEVVGVIAIAAAWIGTGFGLLASQATTQRIHGHLHARWSGHLFWILTRILGADITIHHREVIDPGPVLVIARHVSLADAIMPTVLLTSGETRSTPAHVVMKGLRWAPCIDLVGHRSPNHFVDRSADDRDTELTAIARVGSSLSPECSGVIFPEGGFRTPERFARVLSRLEKTNPRLAHRAASLHHVLPPRPLGTREFLAAAPADCDVVVIAHEGFQQLSTLADIVANTPIEHPIVVELQRIERSEIPLADIDAFTDWLMDRYEWIDARIDEWIDSGVGDSDDQVVLPSA